MKIMRQGLLPLPLLLLLLLLPKFASGGARIYSIHPIGGPVRGDTSITVLGYSLENIECVFTPPPIRDAPPAVGVPCRYEPEAPDVGFRCTCQVPPAPRLSTMQQVVDPATGTIAMMNVPIDPDAYISGAVVVTPASFRGVDFAPFDLLFTYYDLNRIVNVTSIEPTAGHPELHTLVTVHGNAFASYGGIYCSFPGPNWDALLWPGDPEWPYQEFANVGTLVDQHTILCDIPPMTNNSDPVFLEVCLSGHPDLASSYGRARRDDFCTSSLVRFDYIDFVRTNLTYWNTSVIAGPASGGTRIRMFGKFGFTNFLTLQPEFDGLPDYGRPTCVFGQGLGRGAPRPPTLALAVPATLFGARPLRFHLDTSLGDNTTVPAHVGRKRMCIAPRREDAGGTDRSACSCEYAQALEPQTPPCGCGCRELLRRSATSDFDLCVDRATGADAAPDVACGPVASALHRRLEAVPALYAECVSPPVAQPGVYGFEYAPAGDARSTSNSQAQRVDFWFYQAQVTSVAPLAVPLEGGTRFAVSGMNLAPFAIGTKISEPNIYGVPSQIRVYDAQPLCFIGGRENAVGATLELCTNAVPTWTIGDAGLSGCRSLRCQPAPAMAQADRIELRISLNGQWDSSE